MYPRIFHWRTRNQLEVDVVLYGEKGLFAFEIKSTPHILIKDFKPLNLEKTVESATSAYCTDSSRLFDDFSPHRMGDTASVKNHQKVRKNQHIRNSRYDSTAFSRLNVFKEDYPMASCFMVYQLGLRAE